MAKLAWHFYLCASPWSNAHQSWHTCINQNTDVILGFVHSFSLQHPLRAANLGVITAASWMRAKVERPARPKSGFKSLKLLTMTSMPESLTGKVRYGFQSLRPERIWALSEIDFCALANLRHLQNARCLFHRRKQALLH